MRMKYKPKKYHIINEKKNYKEILAYLMSSVFLERIALNNILWILSLYT